MISVVLASRGIAPFNRPYFQLLSIFYAIGPALAAMIVSQVTHGKTGIRDLNKGLIRWRVSLIWYIVAVLGSAILLIVAQAVTKLLGLTVTIITPPVTLSPYVIFGLGVNFLANTCEEIGWRGFALPHLQKRYNALIATLIVGILWGLWHLPLVFLVGHPMSEFPFVWFITIVADAFIYTWIYNSTKGSILLVALFHGSGNLWELFISSRTQLITQKFGLQALSSKESAKNQCVINSVQLLNWGVPCRIRSSKLCGGDHSDRSIWKSASLSPPEGLCGLKWGCN
ncbi:MULTISPECIES: CPBP family intramembrane glutamic endopeptidase [unclassified Microcoleus]